MSETKKNSLLIIDDDTASLMVLSDILQSEYKLYTGKDGATAVEKAEKYLPDLVLLDIIMPDMDGYEVFALLQESDKAKHIPVIFITGLSNLEDEKKGLRLGAVDYISKPFDDMIVKLRVALQIRLLNQLRTIEYLSTTDQLTKLPNRRAFDDRLNMEWHRSIRENQSIAILMIDVDYFKKYNDKYGHQQGDKALESIARVFEQALKRHTDFVARWGGEEFVILLPNTNGRDSLKFAEDMRKSVECTKIPLSDGASSILTVSIGVNSQVPAPDNLLAEFISGADKALYAVKEAGRNSVCLYDG